MLTFCASESRKLRQVEKHFSPDVARSDRRRACTYTVCKFVDVFLTDPVLAGESLLCAKLEGLHRGLELVHAGVDGITSRGPRRACEQDGYERELGEHLVYSSASARQSARQSRVEKCRNISDPKDRRTQSSSSGGIRCVMCAHEVCRCGCADRVVDGRGESRARCVRLCDREHVRERQAQRAGARRHIIMRRTKAEPRVLPHFQERKLLI